MQVLVEVFSYCGSVLPGLTPFGKGPSGRKQWKITFDRKEKVLSTRKQVPFALLYFFEYIICVSYDKTLEIGWEISTLQGVFNLTHFQSLYFTQNSNQQKVAFACLGNRRNLIKFKCVSPHSINVKCICYFINTIKSFHLCISLGHHKV